MRLTRLYSNLPEKFVPIDFSPGLNVVLGEVRLPKNKEKDTHNLGKTTLGRVLDFCLLAGRDPKFFLFKHDDLFKDFVFFLELELLSGSFLTIRRAVDEASKISFKQTDRPGADLSRLTAASWDHSAVSFEKAKSLLDGYLDLRDLKPWPFRKLLGYLVRSQEDFRDVFHLKKFAGPHADWKPFLARILGFDAAIIEDLYANEDELARKTEEETIVRADVSSKLGDLSKIEGLLHLKQEEAKKKQRLLESFDFREADVATIRHIVDDLDAQIAHLNGERYSLALNHKKLTSALKDASIIFDPERAAVLFAEAGILFNGQLRHDFEQLIAFNRAITDERRGYLQDELAEVNTELLRVGETLQALGQQRSEALSFLKSADVFEKYRRSADELVTLRADILALERQRAHMGRLQGLRTEIRALDQKHQEIQDSIEADVKRRNSDNSSLFSQIRLFFSEIVEQVIDRKALLSVTPNKHGHLDFNAEILDDSGNATSADLGFTYRKLLCVAFDLALLRAHVPGRYPRFVFHDGVLESLDDRKKRNLVDVIRSYTSIGIQQIVTLIDSDLPDPADGEGSLFQGTEIVLRLHDENERGRLFRMKPW